MNKLLCLLLLCADPAQVQIVSQHFLSAQAKQHSAVRFDDGTIVGRDSSSINDGRTWTALPTYPSGFVTGLPNGWRRNIVSQCVFNTENGRQLLYYFVIAIDADLGGSPEPPAAVQNYYVRYWLSTDKGTSWQFDEPLIAVNQTAGQPVSGITIGQNAFYLGDKGCIPLQVGNKLLVPMQATVMNQAGTALLSPGGPTYYFFDVVIAEGTLQANNRFTWTTSRIPGNAQKSVRGFFEPTLAQLANGKVLCIMRGQNGGATDPNHALLSRKWMSIGDGTTWSEPTAWTFKDGTHLTSPSSMSVLYTHPTGRIFWFGNDSDQPNVNGQLPRYPFVVIEVDARTGLLIQSTRVVIDKQETTDLTQGRLDIIHPSIFTDKHGAILVSYPRNHNAYQGPVEHVLTKLAL